MVRLFCIKLHRKWNPFWLSEVKSTLHQAARTFWRNRPVWLVRGDISQWWKSATCTLYQVSVGWRWKSQSSRPKVAWAVDKSGWRAECMEQSIVPFVRKLVQRLWLILRSKSRPWSFCSMVRISWKMALMKRCCLFSSLSIRSSLFHKYARKALHLAAQIRLRKFSDATAKAFSCNSGFVWFCWNPWLNIHHNIVWHRSELHVFCSELKYSDIGVAVAFIWFVGSLVIENSQLCETAERMRGGILISTPGRSFDGFSGTMSILYAQSTYVDALLKPLNGFARFARTCLTFSNPYSLSFAECFTHLQITGIQQTHLDPSEVLRSISFCCAHLGS